MVSLEEEISQLNSEREELLAEIDAATSDANTNIESLTAEKVSMTYTFLPIKFLKTRSDAYFDLTLIILNCWNNKLHIVIGFTSGRTSNIKC